MCKRLIATIALVTALGGTSTAFAGPDNATPASPGACHMLNTSDQGMSGMMNDTQVYTIMIPLVYASLGAGCTP
jgi:hypothetical protein